MKRLIGKKEIELLIRSGESVLILEPGVIVTPLAKDIAREHDITISEHAAAAKCEEKEKKPEQKENILYGIDVKTITEIIQKMMQNGQLKEIVDAVRLKSFCSETDTCGFRLIKGNTVTVNTQNQYQEVLKKDEGFAAAGFYYLDENGASVQKRESTMAYLTEGVIDYNVNGKTYTAYPGDVIYLPANVRVDMKPHYKSANLFCVSEK